MFYKSELVEQVYNMYIDEVDISTISYILNIGEDDTNAIIDFINIQSQNNYINAFISTNI